ncbi:oligosaccharide flippase family protein [Mesorhizobium sp. WSM3626]|uniref:oligosaccharide flippase family protein n=1 Tax=Mesorhizobium sp. WSM3626 TaxID=1040987 RepID=UPI0018DDF4B2|nr:oligosaccharide flippase family protein [Mesorhizobium sp. WSM3626]
MIASLRTLIGRSADIRVFSAGLLWSTFGTVIVRLTPMITTILISHWFGIEFVGKFGVTYGTLMSSSLLASAGVSLMATRNIAAYSINDPATAGRLAGMAFLLTGGAAALIGLMIFLFAHEIAGRLLKQPELAFYLQIIAPVIVVNAMNTVQTAILSGIQAFRTIARLNVIFGGLMITLVPVGLYFYGLSGSFIALGCAYLGGCLIAYPAVVAALRRRGIEIAFREAFSQWRLVTRYAVPALLASLLYEPVNWICTAMVVNNPDGLAQVGLYFIAMQLETLLLFVPQIVVQVVIPMLSTGFGEADRRRVINVLGMGIGTNIAIAIGFVVVMMTFGNWFLVLFKLDPAQHWPIFMIVVLAAAIIAAALPLGQVPVSSGYMWTGLSITAGWALTFIIATWFLQDRGALGIVMARAIAWSLQTVVYIGFTRFAIGRTCGEKGTLLRDRDLSTAPAKSASLDA